MVAVAVAVVVFASFPQQPPIDLWKGMLKYRVILYLINNVGRFFQLCYDCTHPLKDTILWNYLMIIEFATIKPKSGAS